MATDNVQYKDRLFNFLFESEETIRQMMKMA